MNQNTTQRLSPESIARHKKQTPLVCLTAYSKPVAEYLDRHVDLLLVGDSLGMVLYGFESTRDVTVEMMINHGRAVMRGSTHACVIIDLPFGSYEDSPAEALETARRVIKETGASGVKLEGGAEMAGTVKTLTGHNIPVLGHIGLLPQHSVDKNGFRIQGRTADDHRRIIDDARALEKAGAFAIVIEGTVEDTAREASNAVAIPTIGIGASPECDGQILVTDDLLGLFSGFRPKFVKPYGDLKSRIEQAAMAYANDVQGRVFPGPEHVYQRDQT